MSTTELNNMVNRIMYGAGFIVWVTFTFLYFVNTENHEEDPINSLVIAIVFPPCLLILFLAACWIMLFRADKRVSAIDKVFTGDSWDWVETVELISMFSDSYD